MDLTDLSNDPHLREIRAVIADQINRHVAMKQDHRAWLAQDISGRVCALVVEAIRDEREKSSQAETSAPSSCVSGSDTSENRRLAKSRLV